MSQHEEYLRRNLMHAKACGAHANTSAALRRLEMQARPPRWLVKELEGIMRRLEPLPNELAQWRNLAPDAPEYVKAESAEGGR